MHIGNKANIIKHNSFTSFDLEENNNFFGKVAKNMVEMFAV